jgi:methylated-DNA-[protein]-cysteine S-methyltransferase
MSNIAPIWYDELPTPIGTLRLVADDHGLREVWFEQGRHQKAPQSHWTRASEPLALARQQLMEYFAGERQQFDLPLHPHGTPFQLKVWLELARIPYGVTISYGELARRIEQPQAVRAVGAANGRNPLPIVLPCHRVIGSDGSLTGFGGGLPTKRYLLSLEDGVAHGDLFSAGPSIR